MKFEELKKTLKEKLSLQKNDLKKSDEEMEIEAAGWWNRWFEASNKFTQSNSNKGDFEKLGELLKQVNLSFTEFDTAERDGLIHFLYAPTNMTLGATYATYFDEVRVKRDYDEVGRKVRMNLNKLFKSAVYKEGAGLLILDADEFNDMFERRRVSVKELETNIVS